MRGHCCTPRKLYKVLTLILNRLALTYCTSRSLILGVVSKLQSALEKYVVLSNIEIKNAKSSLLGGQ